jgi:hypothetical protein
MKLPRPSQCRRVCTPENCEQTARISRTPSVSRSSAAHFHFPFYTEKVGAERWYMRDAEPTLYCSACGRYRWRSGEFFFVVDKVSGRARAASCDRGRCRLGLRRRYRLRRRDVDSGRAGRRYDFFSVPVTECYVIAFFHRGGRNVILRFRFDSPRGRQYRAMRYWTGRERGTYLWAVIRDARNRRYISVTFGAFVPLTPWD